VHIFVDTLTQFLIPIPANVEAHTGINIIMVGLLDFLAGFRASTSVFSPFSYMQFSLRGAEEAEEEVGPPTHTHISIINYRTPIVRYSALCSMWVWALCLR